MRKQVFSSFKMMTCQMFFIFLALLTILNLGNAQQQQQQQQQQQYEAIIDPQGSVTTTETTTETTSSSTINQEQDEVLFVYGVDKSWPMHHHPTTTAVDGDDIHFSNYLNYVTYMEGCKQQADHCDQFEKDRIEMNLQQPPAMENYTYAGFAKVSTPQMVHDLLLDLWEQNEHYVQEQQQDGDSKITSTDHNNNNNNNNNNNIQNFLQDELWDPSNTYVNHWQVPTKMLDIMKYLTQPQLQSIVKAVQPVLEAWTQQSLVLTSIYGIRAYYKGAILAPHVDRLPLVTSCIIHVASSSSSSSSSSDQDQESTQVDPWILEVIDHHGKAHNVTMNPGDMVLYESHSVIHGRPYPLQGDYYANVFLHFEPIGHTIRHAQKGAYGTDVQLPDQAERAYEQALAKAKQQQQQQQKQKQQQQQQQPKQQQQYATTSAPSSVRNRDLPLYVSPTHSVSWKQQFDFERNDIVAPKPTKQTLGLLTPHLAAADGLLEVLKEIASKDRSQLFKGDHNGWRPLHEAARAGHAHVVEYLLKEGAQVNERTNNGLGGNALYWAERPEKIHSQKHKETADIIKQYGGVKLMPKGAKSDKKQN